MSPVRRRRWHHELVLSLVVVAGLLPGKAFSQTNISVVPFALPATKSPGPSDVGVATPSAVLPSMVPSFSPSESSQPSISPAPTVAPSPQPSSSPTETPHPTRSHPPSQQPSFQPSTHRPSDSPSFSPTSTYLPSVQPSVTFSPSDLPSESPAPTPVPSWAPTMSRPPTELPTTEPSVSPSTNPSQTPSMFPTLTHISISEGFFTQNFILGGDPIDDVVTFTDEQLASFEKVMEGYTVQIAEMERDRAFLITTDCTVLSQSVQERPVAVPPARRYLNWEKISFWPWSTENKEIEQRKLQETENFVSITYLVDYRSRKLEVEDYDIKFRSYVTNNLVNLTSDLRREGLTNIARSEAPSQDALRTNVPSLSPSTTLFPSASPSGPFSADPSFPPSAPPTRLPTSVPISVTSSPLATPLPTGDGGLGPGAIVGIILVVGVVGVGVAAYPLWRRRERMKEKTPRTNGISQAGSGFGSPAPEGNLGGVGSPADAIMSKGSLLSVGNSADDYSDHEGGNRQQFPADPFYEFKDPKLEKMRTDIDYNLTGFESMMSEAMTKVLVDEDDPYVDRDELNWGGSSDNPLDIEASALYLVSQWLRQRKSVATVEERRDFMQQMLNKMVASVRHGVIGPEQGSQTIHECAAMLDFELEVEIPETAIIVVGMRKTVNRNDMQDAFGEFGKIDYVSIASSSRGFGLVRFQSTSSVRKAIEKYQKEGEIVVQDVGVHVREINSSEFGGDRGSPVPSGGVSITRDASKTNSPMGFDDPDRLRLD